MHRPVHRRNRLHPYQNPALRTWKRAAVRAGAPIERVLIGALAVAIAAASPALPAAAPPGLGLEDFAEPWRWRTFDHDATLSSSPVFVLGHDPDDMIYAACEDGLYRHNGYQWDRLASSDPIGQGPFSKLVDSDGDVYLAGREGVWIVVGGLELHRVFDSPRFLLAKSPGGGLYVIDLSSNRQLLLERSGASRIEGGDPVPLPRGELHDYAIDDRGQHWLAAGDGLYRRDLRKGFPWKLDADLGPELRGLACTRLFLVKFQSIQRGTLSNQVDDAVSYQLWASFAGSDGRPILARQESSGKWTAFTGAGLPAFDHIVRDGRGRYYATTAGGQLYFSITGEGWKAVPRLGIRGVKVRSGQLDLHGYLWFALEYSERRGGVARFDPESRRWERIVARQGPFEGEDELPRLFVLSLLEASDGSIWIGAESGLYQHLEGAVYTHRAVGRTPLLRITGIAEDRKGRVWVSSTAFPGAYYFDKGRWFQYGNAEFNRFPIRRIASDPRGELWFLPSAGDVPEPSIFRVTASRRAASSSGDEDLDRFAAFRVPVGPINDFLKAQDGSYWAATEKGLLRLQLRAADAAGGSKERKEELALEETYGESEGLRSSRIWAVSENPVDGSIWICYPSSGSGVTRIRDRRIEHFDERDGLGSPIVWSISSTHSDRGSNVWLGTDRGISRFDGECWYHYPVAGLEPHDSKVWPIIPSASAADSILVGTTTSGVFLFRPDDFRRPRFVSTDLARTRRGARGVAFSWAARDFKEETPQRELLFRYRLDGGAWSPATARTEIEIEGLAAGEHSFQVEVRDLDGNTNRNPVFQRFVVTAPPRLPMAALAALLAAGGLALLAALAWTSRSWQRRRHPLLSARGAYDGVAAAVLVVDAAGRVFDYNGASPELLGFGPGAPPRRRLRGLPAMMVPALQDEALRQALRGSLDEGRIGQSYRSLHQADGSERSMACRTLPLRDARGGRIVGAVVELSDETGAERERRHELKQARFSAMRDLADKLGGRLADELKELRRALAGVEDGLDPAQRSLLETIKLRSIRVEELSTALEEFSSLESLPSLAAASPAALVDELLRPSPNGAFKVPDLVQVDFRAQPACWGIRVDAEAMQRALLEILRNAAEAMPEGGKLTIRVANRRFEEPMGSLPPGRYVEISVADQGPGMDEAQRLRVFDPLFSTKPSHRHRGLGLTAAHSIVRRHGGDIAVDSGLGRGTRVLVYLPAAGAGGAGDSV